MEIHLYNTLTRKKEVFKPIKKGKVGIYSCGPTVYWFQHIGNFRTALMADLLKRILSYNDYKIVHVMNSTDVDDKTINASRKEAIPLKELTSKYEAIYLKDIDSLNIIKPNHFLRATDNIKEMISLIQLLLKKGLAYITTDGVYFSISKSKAYGKLAGLDKMAVTKERVMSDEYDKTSAKDFALWKFYSSEDGNVYWDAPFGKGRPGWHIECSAMSMKELGETIDIHTGGMDLTFPHHTNEIAQSEGATGKKFVNYWIHGGMLNLKEGKMSKSLGNIYTLEDLQKKGFEPIHYRYLCLQTHYRKPLDFSFESLDASKNAYEKIKRKVIEIRNNKDNEKIEENNYYVRFLESINDDLNIPKALEVFWNVLDAKDINIQTKIKLLEKFDTVLGLGISEMKELKITIPKDIQKLVDEREKARKEKRWQDADSYRQKLLDKGFTIVDTVHGPKLNLV